MPLILKNPNKKIEKADSSILQEGYLENPEIDCSDGDQYLRNIALFNKFKIILNPYTRPIYEYIKNFCIDYTKNHPQYPKYIWKPKICDIGCGGGFGANIMSQEADFVWGIDIDKNSIKWANEVFARHKNSIYYTSQLSFEVIDVVKEDREIMKFDIVSCIELIEHVDEYQKLLDFIKRICKKNKSGNYIEPPDGTIVFISTPNRNHKGILTRPQNKRHVREWTPEEMYKVLTDNFKYVTLMDFKGNLQELDTKVGVILFKCETPK